MGFQSGLCWYDPVTGVSEKIVGFEEGLNTRPNDAKCDREYPTSILLARYTLYTARSVPRPSQ